VVGVLGTFYDLFAGVGSFAAGAVSNRFGYPAAFYMAVASLAVAAVAGIFVFQTQDTETLARAAVVIREGMACGVPLVLVLLFL
jgi:MFS-type transporter involved in bile tolerance (Atg22 family)